ncbi:MAG: lytic transglycosylase domain-containing protein [Longimicrobiales bacterium]
MIAKEQGEGVRRPGFPVYPPPSLDKEDLLRQNGVHPQILRRRLLILGGGLLLILLLLAFAGPVEEGRVSLPHVAEIAPSLSLPLEMNKQVERWMERYLTDQRPVFQRYLEREGLYSDMIRDALRRRGMPEDLVYLAAIESGFTPSAISRVSAMGMWQFMGPTAEAFGLRIDGYVDERRDPIRATEAALDYLQALHDRFGSWYLAAAAYNAGPTRVAWALSGQEGKQAGEEELYWQIVDLLPTETRVYVPKILAAILLSRTAEEYGFEVERAKPVRFDRVWVPGGTTLAAVAKSTDVPLARIRELNPHLLRGVTPPGEPFGIRVPPGKSSLVVASLGSRWRSVSVDD